LLFDFAENVTNFKYFKLKRTAAIRGIKRLVIAGQSHNQIQQQLNLNERTYWRYWIAAFAKDRARLFSTVSSEEVQTQVAMCHAYLLVQSRHGYLYRFSVFSFYGLVSH
jgi:hypothetical protein